MSADVQRAGLEAVFDQNEQGLRDALARGFHLEEFRSVDRHLRWDPSIRSASPVSPFLRTITLNWYPGWHLLLHAFPDHIRREGATGFPILWETAVHKARRPMLQDLFKMGVNPLVRDHRQRSSIHLLFEGLREEALDRPSPVDVVLCAKWLAGKGLDVFDPHPGEFHPGDLYKEGHTIWTYALTQEAWHVAQAMIPHRWEEVVRTPRWKMALEHFRQRCARGSIRTDIGYELWGRFLSRFLNEWMAETGDLLTDAVSLPWVTRMTPESRALVWSRWSEPDAIGRTGWHRVAQHAHLPEMATVLHLAQAEGVPLVDRWTQAEKYGERPMDAWAYALAGRDTPLPADAWQEHHRLWKALPEAARTLTDEVHDPSVDTLLAGVNNAWSRASPRHTALYENDVLRAHLAAFQLGAASSTRRRL